MHVYRKERVNVVVTYSSCFFYVMQKANHIPFTLTQLILFELPISVKSFSHLPLLCLQSKLSLGKFRFKYREHLYHQVPFPRFVCVFDAGIIPIPKICKLIGNCDNKQDYSNGVTGSIALSLKRSRNLTESVICYNTRSSRSIKLPLSE